MNATATLRRHPRTSFALVALAMLAGHATMIPWHARGGHGPLPDWTLAVDLLLVLPLLWWWLQPAPRAIGAWLGAAAVALAGIWVGAWLLPDASKQLWLWLEPLRWMVIGVLLLGQLCLVTLALRPLARVLAFRRRAQRSGDTPQGLLETDLQAVLDAQAAQAAQTARAAGLAAQAAHGALPWLKLEARFWLYALAPRRWLDGTPPAGEQWFRVHRQGQNLSNQLGFVVLAAAEIPVVHLLLHLGFGPLVAGIVTAISVYGALFLWAEARATRWRPVGVDGSALHLRHGLVHDLRVPRAAIIGAGLHRGDNPRRAPGRLRCAGMGRANLRLQLRPGTRLGTLTGEREVREIFLGVDEPERLLRALDLAGDAAR